MLGLVLVIVAMVSALTAMRFAIHGQEVAVPALVGLAPGEAERAAAGLGLQMSIERQYYSPQIPEGGSCRSCRCRGRRCGAAGSCGWR
jgi:eukaryotic-like serine/threonine-protein kinase